MEGCLSLITLESSRELRLDCLHRHSIKEERDTVTMGKASLKAKEKLDAVLNNPNRNDNSGKQECPVSAAIAITISISTVIPSTTDDL